MSAESLRLTLVLIGLAVLGLIWLLYRPEGRERRKGASRKREVRRDPSLSSRHDEAPSDDDDKRSAAADADELSEPRQPTLPEFELQDEMSAAHPDSSSDLNSGRREPSISLPDFRWTDDEQPAGDTTARSAEDASVGNEEKTLELAGKRVVTLYLKSRGEQRITGATLLDAAIKAGLRFGEMKIFHRRHRGESLPVFSMANLEQPGNFDPAAWNLFESRGVSLFMTLPGPVSALDAWDAMLATAQRLSTLLDCHLLDERQSALTRESIGAIREELREFDRSNANDG